MASRTSMASGRLSSASKRLNGRGLDCRVVFWDGKEKGRSFTRRGFDPDSSAVTLNHALANCQSDAGAGIFPVTMEPLENTEDYLLVMGIDADAVVPHREAPRGALAGGRDVDFGRIFRSIFECVADEILKYLLQVGFAHADLGQWVASDRRVVLPDSFRQAGKSVLQNRRCIHCGQVTLNHASSGIGEQIVDERRQPASAFPQESKELLPFGI